MGNVDVHDFLDFLDLVTKLTPGSAGTLLILAVGLTVVTVSVLLALGQWFIRLTPARRRDIINLVAALRRAGRHDDD